MPTIKKCLSRFIKKGDEITDHDISQFSDLCIKNFKPSDLEDFAAKHHCGHYESKEEFATVLAEAQLRFNAYGIDFSSQPPKAQEMNKILLEAAQTKDYKKLAGTMFDSDQKTHTAVEFGAGYHIFTVW